MFLIYKSYTNYTLVYLYFIIDKAVKVKSKIKNRNNYKQNLNLNHFEVYFVMKRN